MTSNPILHDTFVRLHHILICVLLGLCYAGSFGFTMHSSAIGTTVDAIACMGLFFGEAVMLWSIFTYSRFEVLEQYQSLVIHAIYAIAAAALMLVGEYLLMSVLSSSDTAFFLTSLPARAFVLLIMYTSYQRYYTNNKMEEDSSEPAEDIVVTDKDEPVAEPVEAMERITVKVGTKIKVIPVDDIVCLKAEDDYVSVITAEGHWLKSERLKDYDMSLPADRFARVHRSYIVNISKISKIERYGQKQMLSLSNGEQIRISMTGYKVLKEKLNL